MAGDAETTEGMGRGGYYDTHSEYQRAVAESGAQLIERCVAAIPLPDSGQSYLIADYGSSTGANSIKTVTAAAEAVRKRAPAMGIAVLHNDVPTNDFNQLFANLVAAPHSCLTLHPPGLPMASASSFFEPSAPGRSVRLGTSFSAAHWLSLQPDVVLPGGFYFDAATGDAKAAIERQAAADWTTFLRARATELATGGRLLVQCVGTDADGNVTASKLLAAMSDVANQMVDDGLLTRDAVNRYVLPVYARTEAEARKPLTDDADLARAFVADEITVKPVANPYFTKWQQDHDDTAYAKAYTAFVRGFTESSLRLHLLTDDARVNQYFARLEARFAADPERDVFEDWTLTVVLSRTDG